MNPPLAAMTAGYAALLWLMLIILLHFLKPGLNPAISMCSEYARGRFGWIMRLAFFSMAIGCWLLVFATWFWLSHFGLILLGVIGVGFTGAGLYVTDPVAAGQEKTTRSGNLHNLFAAIAIILYPVMMTVLTISILHSKHWPQFHSWIIVLAAFGWLGCLGFIWVMVFSVQNKNIPFGYYQRLMIFAMSAWLIVTALSSL